MVIASKLHEWAGPTLSLLRFNSAALACRVADLFAIGTGRAPGSSLSRRHLRQTAAMLCTMSDAALKDIGVHRPDVRAITDTAGGGASVPRRSGH